MNVNPRVTTHMTESSFNFRLSHFQKVVDMYKDSPDNRKLADANLDNNRRRIFDLLTKSAGKYDNSRLNNKLPVGFEGMVDGLKEQMAEFMKVCQRGVAHRDACLTNDCTGVRVLVREDCTLVHLQRRLSYV